MPEQPANIAIIVLAAGASTRLGQPKQLLQWQDKILLTSICETALAMENGGVIVVLGAHCEAIQPTIEHLPVQIVINEKWNEGMGSSIACGMSHLTPHTNAVLLLLCDQPFVSQALLNNLMETWRESAKPIVVAQYGDTLGVPALFDHRCFEELSKLTGQQGAKSLIMANPQEVAAVPFPEGAIDLDTPSDLEAIQQRYLVYNLTTETPRSKW